MSMILFSRRKKALLFTSSITVMLVLSWEFLLSKNVEFQPSFNFRPANLVACRRQNRIACLGISPTELHLVKQAESLRTAKMKLEGVDVKMKPGKAGEVNLHEFRDLCGGDLRTLLYFPLFPDVPTSRKLQRTLKIYGLGAQYGKRIFGYIIAPKTATYSFRLEASGSSEMWLSSNEKPQNCQHIASVINPGKPHHSSNDIKLTASRLYYFDILHKHGDSKNKDRLHVKWRFDAGTFQDISPKFLKAFYDDSEITDNTVNFNSFVAAGFKHSPSRESSDMALREKILKLPFINEITVRKLFTTCDYKPISDLCGQKVNLFQSPWEAVYTGVYPTDHSNRSETKEIISFGNDLVEESEAKQIVSQIVERIQSIDRKYKLKDIVSIEKKHSRYFVELLLEDTNTGGYLRFSEYVYLQNSGKLCYPKGFSWNRSSMVNLIVVSGRNQAKWVYHFINNIQRIQQQLKDNNINVIIVDFLSPNADLKVALEKSLLPNYMLFENTAKFEKSLAIQQGANGGVLDPDGIVVVLDLHLEVPVSFIEDVRKHTIKGRQVFSPVLERLNCGSMPGYSDNGAFWEFHGYGLVGVYKEDWDRFGGMNYEKFRDKWGGEDVEMADRILMSGMELERRKVVDLSHYFHTKKGMWNNRK